MVNAEANITVKAKNAATQEFNAIFSQVNAQMGKNASVAKVLEETYRRLAKSYKDAATEARSGGTATGTAIAQLNKMSVEAANTAKSIAEADKQSGKFKISIVDLAAKLYLVQVGIRNVVQALQGIYEFGKLGATVEQTARSYQMVADNIGIAAGQLELLREASRGTISDMRLMQMSNQALVGTTGDFSKAMADALPKLLEIARASAILNPQLGDTEQQFDRLTLGLKRLEPRIIDDIGLEIRLTEVNKDYAEQLGKSVDSLTTQERSYALLNAVLARHGDYLDLVQGKTDSSLDSYDQMEASLENLKDTLAEKINPVISNGADIIGDWASNANKMVEAGADLNTYLSVSKDMWKSLVSNILEAHIAISQFLGIVSLSRERLIELGLIERDFNDIMDDRRESVEAFRRGLVDSVGAIELVSEEEEKWREQRDETLDDLFLKELDINQKLIDQRAKLGQKSIDIDTDYQDRLTEIHAEAEEDRIDIATRAAEEREDIQRRYNERIADIDKDIAQLKLEYEDENPFLSETTQQKLDDFEAYAENIRDTLKKLRREQRLDPNDEREQFIDVLEAQLDEAEKLLSDTRKDAREEERKARIAFRMQEKEEEKKALEERRDQEINILNEQLRIKLETSVKSEEDLTAQVTAEYTKRRIAINNEMNQIAEEANRRMKEATVDALLSLVPAGSAAEQKLMEMKLKIHGATDEMIAQFWRTRDSIAGPDSLVSAIDRFAMAGFATFFNMQGVVAGLNGQLMFTNFLLGQQQELMISTGGGGVGMRRQHGGPVSANRPYVVGEAGPELFVPSGAGNIVPNDQMGGGTNLTININAAAFQGSQADAIRFGNWVGPIVLQYLDRFGGNVNAVGARKIRSG